MPASDSWLTTVRRTLRMTNITSQSDGKRHLAPHGGVKLAIMNVPAFLALIKFLILAPNTSMRGEVWHIMPN